MRPIALCAIVALLAIFIITLATAPNSTYLNTRQDLAAANLRHTTSATTPPVATQIDNLRHRIDQLERLLAARQPESLTPLQPALPRASNRNRRRRSDLFDDGAAAVVAATAASTATAASSPAVVSAPTHAVPRSASTLAAALGPERLAPPAPPSSVPNASWWSPMQTQLPGGLWCPKPPEYAAAKPELRLVASPPTDKPVLTEALARKFASPDNMLIVTYVNYHRLDFAFTLVKHLVSLSNPHYLVGALDDEAGRGLQEKGVPTFFMNSGLTTQDYGWGTKNFRQLGLHKVDLVLALAKTGVDCLTIDADAFILRDPFPYFRKLAEADVLTSSDHLRSDYGYEDDGLEGNQGMSSAFNIGYIFIRAKALPFVQQWRDTCHRRPNDWDQVLFMSVLKQSGARTNGGSRLRDMFKLPDGGHLKVGVLPVSLFASGHTHFVTRMAHQAHTIPYMVHTTFQYGGAQGKRHRLRESMIWEDLPEYYAGPKFLRYDADLPYDLVYPKGGEVRPDGTQELSNHMSVEQHFTLVNHQLVQLRNAFALARELGRILILPRLVCGLDRWWAPHKNVIPGSAAQLPLVDCPADHVIDVERMGKPELFLRESSFLCNPRLPAAVRGGIVSVGLDPIGVADAGAAELGAGLIASLAANGAKVLSITSPLVDYRVLLNGAKRKEFERTISSWGGLWCCKSPPGGRGPGHIWYDFLNDIVPHVDRHNRKWDAPWSPTMGP